MSKFLVRNMCPVVTCRWYADTDYFSKNPNNLADRMMNHFENHHPIYRQWILIRARFGKKLVTRFSKQYAMRQK